MTDITKNTIIPHKYSKGALILVVTAVLTFLLGSFFGRIASKFIYFSSGWIGTTEDWKYIFGMLIAPTFFLPFFFGFVRKEEVGLKRFLGLLIVLVIVFNLWLYTPTIIFSAIFIASGYVLAKLILFIYNKVKPNRT